MFRNEALENAGAQRYGEILLTQSGTNWLATTLSIVVFSGLLVYVLTAEYSRKATAAGILVPDLGVIRISAKLGGIVVSQLVGEKSEVQAGQNLFLLNADRTSTSSDAAEAVIASLLERKKISFSREHQDLADQADRRIADLEQQLRSLDGELQKIDAQIGIQNERVLLAKANAEKFRDLHMSGFVSEAQLREKQIDLLDQRQKAAELERVRAGIHKSAAAIRSSTREVAYQARRDDAAVVRNIVTTDLEIIQNNAVRQEVIKAPQGGVISALTTHPGQRVTANQLVAALVPSDAVLEAELYVPSKYSGFIKSGQAVQIRYHAFPYQKYGQAKGTIREISSVAIRQAEATYDNAPGLAAESNDLVYRVRVKLNELPRSAPSSAPIALKVGMSLDASIILETKRVYEIVLEKLFL